MIRALWLLLAVSGALTLAAAPQDTVDTSARAVSRAAGAYVAALGPKLSYVVADETARQVAETPTRVAQERKTLADFFVAYVPAENLWMSVRDVREVDGVAVSDPENIRVLIARAPLARLGAVIAEKNARYNIGSITRTFNEPTLALLVVSEPHRGRFTFDRRHVTARPSGPLVTLGFRERDRPTLVRGPNGEMVFAKGEVDIDARTGRVERTVIEMTLGTVDARLVTTYRHDTGLDLWVPASMTEHYEQRAVALRERVDVETAYANYRRFETTTRIK